MFTRKSTIGNALITAKSVFASIRRSRLLMVFVTVLAWFMIAAMLGTTMWIIHDQKYPWLVYFYNAFTIFSNLNDDLGLTILRADGVGSYAVNIGMMIISFALIISGMIGIALLTATITQRSISGDEEKFDRLIDELRRMAVIATSAPLPNQEPVNAHRILGVIIDHIHKEIIPARDNSTIHQINIYEFEYLFVHIINRIIEHRHLLDEPIQKFAVYDLNKIEDISRWAQSLNTLYPYFSDSQHSPINCDFKRAWTNFSSEFPARIRLLKGGTHYPKNSLDLVGRRQMGATKDD